MSICSSGASTTKAGVPAAVVVDQNYIKSILPAGLAWAYPYLPFMHGLEIGDVGAFCAVDPPLFTVPTGADIFDFLTGGPLSNVKLVNDFLVAVTKSYLWYSLCQCSAPPTPAAPAAPAAPVNLPAVNPAPYVGLPATTPCDDPQHADLNIPVGATSQIVLSGLYTGKNVTSVRFLTTTTVVTGPGPTIDFSVFWIQPNFQPDIAGPTWSLAPGGSLQQIFVPPAGTIGTRLRQQQGAGAGSVLIHRRTTAFCNGDNPSGVSSPCCAPDPVGVGLLAQILQTVELIQRQSAPFGYVPGATHAGLAGSGELTVSGLIGVKVDITAAPPGVIGTVAGDPVTLFEAGWINWGSADGFLIREFISSDPFLSFPSKAGALTKIGYSLNAGVTATILELVREP